MFGISLALTLYAVIAFILIGVALTSMILFTKAKLVKSDLCKIKINDEPELTKEVKGGGTLLSALTSQGIAIPCPCGGKATCLQCRVQIVEGAEPPIETDRSTFTRRELQEGWRLSCQTKLKHDIRMHVPEHLLEVKEWIGIVRQNDNVATFIKELVINVDEEVHYRSGGYLQVHVPPFKTNTTDWKASIDPKFQGDWEKFGMFGVEIDYSHLPTPPQEVIRAYSMASYPEEGRKLLFNIRIATPPFDETGKVSSKLPWGICSSYAFSLKPGDKIRLSGPFGESFMIEDSRELIFLIGGAGSSFGRSHILHLFKTEKTKRKVSLWYGARSLKENIYEKEFKELDTQFPNFQYNLVLSEPMPEDFESGWPKKDPLKTGFVFRAFEEGQLKKMDYPEEHLYYVCGPPMHNISVMRLLDNYGVPREHIVLDDFGS